jgi:hypothetical protein
LKISLIIVIEPDMNLARANFKARLINTLTSCVVACISLVIFGATFHAMLIAIVTVAIAAVAELSEQPATGTDHCRDPFIGCIHRHRRQ